MKRVYIGIGSNLGKRMDNINKSIAFLKRSKVKLDKISSFYETSPVGNKKQPWFINCVFAGTTNLNAFELLEVMRDIENKLCRKKTVKWGPRTIDLDLLLFGNDVIRESDLVVPHPMMHKREFVLKPLLEVNPALKHPVYNRKFSEIFNDLTTNEKVEKVNKACSGNKRKK